MAKIPIEELLKPLSGDNPCGISRDDDIELTNLWREIETEAKGKPEQQFGDTIIDAKPADWKQVHSKCLSMLQSCRHLEPTVYLCAAAVEIDGLPGLRDGLKLLIGLAENFWADVHPLPDPDDPEDYYEREGVFDLMSPAYQETPDDVLKFVERTRNAVLAQAPQVGKVSHADILAMNTKAMGAPTREFVLAAFTQADPDFIDKVVTANNEAVEFVDSLQNYLDEKLGSNSPNLANLRTELNNIKTAIVSFTSGESQAAPESAGGDQPAPQAAVAAAAPTGAPVAGAVVPGTLASRADVVKALNSVISYYKANEPASPVPLLLQRAKALVNNDFLGIIRNFRPDLERDFLAILGVADASDDNAGVAAPPPPPPPPPPPQARSRQPEPEPAGDPWANAKF